MNKEEILALLFRIENLQKDIDNSIDRAEIILRDSEGVRLREYFVERFRINNELLQNDSPENIEKLGHRAQKLLDDVLAFKSKKRKEKLADLDENNLDDANDLAQATSVLADYLKKSDIDESIKEVVDMINILVDDMQYDARKIPNYPTLEINNYFYNIKDAFDILLGIRQEKVDKVKLEKRKNHSKKDVISLGNDLVKILKNYYYRYAISDKDNITVQRDIDDISNMIKEFSSISEDDYTLIDAYYYVFNKALLVVDRKILEEIAKREKSASNVKRHEAEVLINSIKEKMEFLLNNPDIVLTDEERTSVTGYYAHFNEVNASYMSKTDLSFFESEEFEDYIGKLEKNLKTLKELIERKEKEKKEMEKSKDNKHTALDVIALAMDLKNQYKIVLSNKDIVLTDYERQSMNDYINEITSDYLQTGYILGIPIQTAESETYRELYIESPYARLTERLKTLNVLKESKLKEVQKKNTASTDKTPVTSLINDVIAKINSILNNSDFNLTDKETEHLNNMLTAAKADIGSLTDDNIEKTYKTYQKVTSELNDYYQKKDDEAKANKKKTSTAEPHVYHTKNEVNALINATEIEVKYALNRSDIDFSEEETKQLSDYVIKIDNLKERFASVPDDDFDQIDTYYKAFSAALEELIAFRAKKEQEKKDKAIVVRDPNGTRVVRVVPEEEQPEDLKDERKGLKKAVKAIFAILGTAAVVALLYAAIKYCVNHPNGKALPNTNPSPSPTYSAAASPSPSPSAVPSPTPTAAIQVINSIANVNINDYDELLDYATQIQKELKGCSLTIDDIMYAIRMANWDALEDKSCFTDREGVCRSTYNAGLITTSLGSDAIVKKDMNSDIFITDHQMTDILMCVTDSKLTLDDFEAAKVDNKGYDIYAVVDKCIYGMNAHKGSTNENDIEKDKLYARVYNDVVARAVVSFSIVNSEDAPLCTVYELLGTYTANKERILELTGHEGPRYGTGPRIDGNYGNICPLELVTLTNIDTQDVNGNRNFIGNENCIFYSEFIDEVILNPGQSLGLN